MVPEFRNGGYGTGMLVGTARVVGRIAKGRGVELKDVQLPSDDEGEGRPRNFPLALPVIIFIIILVISRIGGGPGAGMLFWALGPWSGWSSGVDRSAADVAADSAEVALAEAGSEEASVDLAVVEVVVAVVGQAGRLNL